MTNLEQRTVVRAQLICIVVAVAFLAVGVLGFIPGVTTHYHGTGGMHFSGPGAMAKLFGVFRVSVFHNGVHLAFALIGLLCAFTARSARVYLVLGGLAYLALTVYGWVVDQDSNANFVPINDADNWLHLGLGIGMVALGVLVVRAPQEPRREG